MLIRTANEKDLNGIVELWKEFMDFHSNLDAAFTRSEDGHEEFYKIAKEKISDPNWQLFVAESNNQIIGYCVAGIEKLPLVFLFHEYGYVEDIAVTQNYRNKGIGKKLVSEIIKWFEAKNVTRVELNLLANNVETEKFWTGMGFNVFTKRMIKNLK